MTGVINGIDVSHWQGDIDYNKVKAAGYDFVMIRCGGCNHPKAGTYKDKKFEQNYKQALAAGMHIGVYVFDYSTTIAGAIQAADWLLKCIEGKRIDYPVAYDIEYDAYNINPNAPWSDMAIAACGRLEQAGYYTMLYTNPDWLSNKYDYNKVKRFDVWLANYSKPFGEKPNTKYSHGIWQYCALGSAADVKAAPANVMLGSVSGCATACDVNYCYRDYADIIKKIGLNHPVKSYTVSAIKSGLTQAQATTLSAQLKALGVSISMQEDK
jgi:GH25 family lysozyme M1 (1,4-beta-N-acetylmuramidase)